MDEALLIARLIFGLGIAAHGAQKLFGWFGGHGIAGTGGFMESMGYKPGKLFALGAGLGEFGGGVLLALGLLGPIGPALMVIVMLVAIFTVHVSKGFFAPAGVEMPLLYIGSALALAFAGFGAFSLDAAFGLSVLPGARMTWTVFAAAVVLAILNLLARRRAPQPAP